MLKKIKHLVLGQSLRSDALDHEKFSVIWGLPVLSSDAISSVSYACEEILMVLIPVLGMASYGLLMKVGFAIVFLLFILVFSYRQTINCYPQGGGSYIVASDNLGKVFGLIAAASLAIDYVLTVAVSVCAGTAAITSAFPQLLSMRTGIALIIISLLTIGNLRGMKDSSVLFGIPTYLFIITILLLIVTGFVKVLIFHETPAVSAAMPQCVENAGLLLFLKAFSSGCTALTGVEAVSDGIPNFREPAQKNAKRVLYLLAGLVFVIFLGISALASLYHIIPNANVTVIAMIAEAVFGNGTLLFYLVQNDRSYSYNGCKHSLCGFTITVVHSGKGWIRAKTVYVKGEPFKLLQWNSVAVFPLCRTRDLFSCVLPSFDAAVCSRCISVFYIITGGNVCTVGEKKGR